jgi:hypothetical protein
MSVYNSIAFLDDLKSIHRYVYFQEGRISSDKKVKTMGKHWQRPILNGSESAPVVLW